MKRIFLIFALLAPAVSQAEPAPRDWIYYTDAALMVMDGYTTSKAIRSGKGVESESTVLGVLAGPTPSDAQIIAYVGLNLGLLEWSRYWNKPLSKGFQWAVLITRPGIIYSNFRIAID